MPQSDASNILVAFNTIVNCKSGFEIGYDGGGFQGNWWKKPPRNVTWANNVMVGKADTLIKLVSTHEDCLWEGNYYFAEEGAVVSGKLLNGIIQTDPKRDLVNGVWKLSQRSPASGGAKGNYPSVRYDIEGKPRKTVNDAGAFEMTNEPSKRSPLMTHDVGPNAI